MLALLVRAFSSDGETDAWLKMRKNKESEHFQANSCGVRVAIMRHGKGLEFSPVPADQKKISSRLWDDFSSEIAHASHSTSVLGNAFVFHSCINTCSIPMVGAACP
jgi:hypothetical protein